MNDVPRENIRDKIDTRIENTEEISESIKAIHGEAYQSAILLFVNLVNVINAHRVLVCSEHPDEVLNKMDGIANNVLADGLYRLACLVKQEGAEEEIVRTYFSMEKDVKVLIQRQRV